ncbi:MAG: tetratricopeptide repeat protein [Gallionellaceae bacterium]|nr:tetratricopeptide repeat protein [Gallionellaceae bacterium]
MKIRRFAFILCCLSLLPALALAATSLPEASQLFRQGRHAQALDAVNDYLSGNPKDPQGRFLKGLIQAELSRTQDAIRTFSELTDDYPELPEPYNNLAVLYASLGQYERAKSSLERAIRTHPSYATAHENLGDIYAKMASVAYDKALQLDKGNTSAQMKLALVKDIFTPAGIDKTAPAAKAAPTKLAATGQAAKPAPAAEVAKVVDAGPPAKMVEEWAAAWSRRDVAAYLSYYAENFRLPSGMTRAAWEAQRNQRLTQPQYIKVELSNVSVTGNDRKATVKFRQAYESSLLKSNTNKTLTLENRGGAWKITSER